MWTMLLVTLGFSALFVLLVFGLSPDGQILMERAVDWAMNKLGGGDNGKA